MTTPTFQACIGANRRKVHIHKSGDLLTLCEKTASVRFVAGDVHHTSLCSFCITRMAEILRDHKHDGDVIPRCDTPDGLALAIGLEKII